MRRIPDADLRSELARLADELDRTPTRREMTDRGEYSGQTYVNRYGSWNAALEGAGLTPNRGAGTANVRHLREHGVTPASELPTGTGVQDKMQGLAKFTLQRNASAGGGGSDALGGMVEPVYYLFEEHDEADVLDEFFEANPQVLDAKTYHGLVQMVGSHGARWREVGKANLEDIYRAHGADPDSVG